MTSPTAPKTQTGGPAFPFNAGEFGIEPASGMTLRDWFAGQALAGYMAHLTANDHSPSSHAYECASEAYGFADAMIAARSEGRAP